MELSPEKAGGEDPFQVSLSVFNGPFNVLLELIAARRLPLSKVSLSTVTSQFVSYVSGLDLSRGADATSSFLLVASVLVEAKSISLLPTPLAASEDLEALRERDLLFARLLEYNAFKQAAGLLGRMMAKNAGFHPHPVAPERRFAPLRQRVRFDMTAADFALFAARVFLNAPRQSVSLAQLHVPVANLQKEAARVKEKLDGAGPLLFSQLVSDATNRGVVVARFLAVLLFFKFRFLQFRQEGPYKPLSLRWVASESEYAARRAQIGWEDYE